MHIVAVHNWRKDESEAAKIIAEAMATVVFESRQKISGGGPAVVACYADQSRAASLAALLSQKGVPAMIVDVEAVRNRSPLRSIRRCEFGPQSLLVELMDGAAGEIRYDMIDLMLAAFCNSGSKQVTATETKRKFSLGKTLLAGGVPMTKTVKTEKTVSIEERDEALWLYTQGGALFVLDRAAMSYEGLGDAMQFTRDLNFSYVKSELRRLAPKARYNDRLLKRAALIRLLGPALDPETSYDLAFEILARSLREGA